MPGCAKWGGNNGNVCLQCLDMFYLQNGICYRFPSNCVAYDPASLVCLKCSSGFQLATNGRCIIFNPSNNCNYFNPSSSNQCYTCKNNFYEYWINQSTG
jgi:hypothetical protein